MEQSLSDAGVSVTTLTTDHDFRISDNKPRVAFFETANGAARIFVHKWTRWYKIAPGFVTYLVRHIKSFDVVHIHALFSFSSTIAAWIARIYGVPYVLRPLGTLAVYGTKNRRRSLKRLSTAWIEGPNLLAAAAVHFTSNAEMNEAKALGLALRGVVIPLGVEADNVGPAIDLRAEYPALRNRSVVLFLSRLDPKKNIEALIDAFALREELKSTSALIIAGDGTPGYVSTLKARARDAGLDDCVIWLGGIAGMRKSAAFEVADIFALPSFSENFGIAAVEAMLAGLPCLLSPGVAIACDAAAANAAMLAETEPSAIAWAMVELLRRGGKNGPMGPLARAHALACYSPAAMARKLIDLYRDISVERNKTVV